MSFDISITSNAVDAIAALSSYSDAVVTAATRASISRALVTGRKQASKTMRQRLNIKGKDVKKKIAIAKPTTGRLGSLNGVISFDDTPMPLIDFVRGSKGIIKQKGLKIKKRRKLKVEVTRGRKFTMIGGFIQKVRSKNVFRRGKSGKLYKQSAPSVGEFVMRREFKFPIAKEMRKSFNKNLRSEIKFRTEREIQKLASKRLKQRQI